MENKRPRAEVTANAVGQPTSIASLPISTLSGQSFFLSNETDSDCISSQSNNMVLTICNELDSEESQDFLCFNDPLMHIKKEEEDLTQVQYHIINPFVGTRIEDGIRTNNTSVSDLRTTPTTVSPTTVQLSSGCDIYVVKEFVEKQESSFDSIVNSTVMKPNTSTQIMSDKKDKQYMLCNPFMVQPPAHMVLTETKDTVYGTELNDNKRNYILETYKKRDDKRRATHNEVERRRRDKINNWIFKLKEMLPEVTTSNYLNASNSSGFNLSSGTAFGKSTVSAPFSQQERGNVPNRTPPNESKSQILIKACEYIRSMQDELKSLRECLSENEKLRLNNQRLQNELDKLKQYEGSNQNYILSNNNNDSCSIGTNASLDDNNTSTSDSFNLALSGFNSNSCMFVTNDPTTMTYTKRELIIRDYVD